MRTKTMFAVLAASACAFAADFPTDQNAVITAPDTYTAAGNLSWATLAVGGAGSFLFDLSGGPYTATLTGTGDNVMTLNAKDTDLTLKGGTWAFTGTAPYFNRAGGTRGVNRSLTLDGATMTGVNTFYIAYGGGDSDATLVLTNGASLTVKNMYTYGNGSGSMRTRLEVVNGSTLTADGTSNPTFRSDDGADGARLGQRILIDGAGSSIVSKGHMTIGNTGSDIACEVRNGAALDVTGKQLVVGNGAKACDNRLVVSNKATVVCDQLRVGSASGSHGNGVLIADGATATVGTLYVGSQYGGTGTYGNTCDVQNATLSCTSIGFGGAGCSNNVLRIAGKSASFSVGNGWKELTNWGSHNVMELTDGASWTTTSNWRTGEGVENEVRVTDGATIDASSFQFILGPQDSTFSYHGDRLFVGADATVSGQVVLMTGRGTEMVVSNGTVKALSDSLKNWNSDGFQLGYFNGENYKATNIVVTLQGERPLLTSNGYIVPQSDTRIVFDIPAGGYAKGHVPITAPRIVFHHSKAVLVPNVEKFREGLTSKTDVTLVQTTGTDNPFTEGTIIADSNAVAPEGCSFRVGDDYKSIVLTVKPPKRGLMLIFR